MMDYRVGDTRDLTAALPDGSVHLVATSPPFLALRSYLPADHEHKHAEIGSEPDPATFLDTLLALTAEWGRVLAPWGSIAIELGDTYSSGNLPERTWPGLGDGKRDDRAGTKHLAAIDVAARSGEWPRPKCLALIPQLYATSLAYGRNILTGAPSPAGQWLVRNLIVWHRPNPAVGALGDKFRPSTSYIVVATRSPKRWFDLTAVRTATDLRATAGGNMDPRNQRDDDWRRGKKPEGGGVANPAGAPPLDAWFDEHDTWTVTTQPSRLAHYAMWPAKLAERLILSMCPEWVCTTCGEPRRRVEQATNRTGIGFRRTADDTTRLVSTLSPARTELEQLGWTDCGRADYAPGVVLDPFAGTGTTLCVADLHGRTGIGFDIDSRNAELVDARRAEVARNLFGTLPEIPGQLDMFGGAA